MLKTIRTFLKAFFDILAGNEKHGFRAILLLFLLQILKIKYNNSWFFSYFQNDERIIKNYEKKLIFLCFSSPRLNSNYKSSPRLLTSGKIFGEVGHI